MPENVLCHTENIGNRVGNGTKFDLENGWHSVVADDTRP